MLYPKLLQNTSMFKKNVQDEVSNSEIVFAACD